MIKEYPLHIDIFALFIFLGAVQGIFLSYFFLSKSNRQIKTNLYLGLLLFVCSLLSIDILFSYTNFMFQVIYLVDSSEPLNFLIGPLFFLYVMSKIDEPKLKNIYIHFLPALFYFIYLSLFHVRSSVEKYNAYLNQYHPELDFIPVLGGSFNDPLLIKGVVNELTIISIFFYLLASAIFVFKSKKKEENSSSKKKIYTFLWLDIGFMTLILMIIIFVKVSFEHDLGDYIIITAICVFIYSTSFRIIRESVFFKGIPVDKKYQKSGLDEDVKTKILLRINELIDEKYYLNPSPSLPDLAKRINASPNYVSQVINEKMNLTFLEMINKHRIEEAKKMILDPELNETVEGIAYLVGFNSKSTFHSAFKRLTGKTPSEYKNSTNNSK